MSAPIRNGTLSDIDSLLQEAGSVDGAGFALIYRRYKRILTHYAAEQGAPDPEAVAQLALLDSFRALDRLENRSEAGLRSYLNRAAAGHVVNQHRRAGPSLAEITEDAAVLDDPAESTIDQLWLRQLVDQLPPDQRDVVENRFLLGLSGRETGDRLGKDPNAVYQLQHRAVRNLRRMIFAVLCILLVMIGAVVIRAASSSSTIDSSPVDRSVDQEGPVVETTVPAPEEVRTEPDDRRPADERLGETQAIETGTELDEQPISTATTAASEPSDGIQTADPEPPPTTTTMVTSAPPIADEPPETTAPPTVRSSTLLNHCGPQMLSPTMTNFKLYNPASSPSRAAAFVRPAAIRFLDGQGTELHRIDTSGAMVRGRNPNTHGWLGAADATGTYAAYENAPPPRLWGVLTAVSDTTGWRTIQALDPSSNTWITVDACSK